MTAQIKEPSGKQRPIRKTAFMTFKKCPRKFFYFYNQSDEVYYSYGKIDETNKPMMYGTWFHDACEKFYKELDGPSIFGVEDVQGYFREKLPSGTEIDEWYDYFAHVEAERYIEYEAHEWLEHFMPKSLELPLYLKDIIDRTGHTDRVDYLPDKEAYCIVEYKTGKSYNVKKQYSLSDLRAEIGFYQTMLNVSQVYDKPVTYWKLINPTLKQVYVEKIPTLSLNNVQRVYRDIVKRIAEHGPWNRKIEILCLWCPFTKACLFPKEEEKPIFGNLSEKLKDAGIDYLS